MGWGPAFGTALLDFCSGGYQARTTQGAKSRLVLSSPQPLSSWLCPPHHSTTPDEKPTAHRPTQVPLPLAVTESLLRAALSKGCPTGHQPARCLGKKNGLVVKQIWEMLHTHWTSTAAGTVIKPLTSPAEKLIVKPCLIHVS